MQSVSGVIFFEYQSRDCLSRGNFSLTTSVDDGLLLDVQLRLGSTELRGAPSAGE